ncbi:Alpha/beta-Hydrolases superfamily protein isoform 1 [Theobroma cacao]|uniref:Alpha/beta-Hydrolases superfamily protein isoform 1 n=1 Tax=Theobroma cacao TaxID=3641 RepID=A0A061E4V6_THECC|nr:Alpha/beta-Hydrolases superfamily protein isoform 1 [Theobroma cacao]
MEKIQHRHVQVRGLKLHLAESGTGPKVVLFLHGFPEIWYSWRHQMIAVANAGYRAIAIDFRGYGLSDQPSEPEKANFNDLVDDDVALLDTFGHQISTVESDVELKFISAFLVGKDFGAVPAFLLAVVHPDTVSGLITLGIPFLIPGPVGIQFDLLPKGFYILRWAEPGRAEADFGRFDVKTVVRNIYILFSGSELQVAGDDQEIMDLVDPSTPLPPWFTEDDLDVYATLYRNSGFRTALQVPYRCSPLDYGVINPKVTAPLLIMGEKDCFIKFPGMEDYMRKGIVKQFMPNLDITFMPEGNHFVQEQLPEQVNELIITFLNKHFVG